MGQQALKTIIYMYNTYKRKITILAIHWRVTGTIVVPMNEATAWAIPKPMVVKSTRRSYKVIRGRGIAFVKINPCRLLDADGSTIIMLVSRMYFWRFGERSTFSAQRSCDGCSM
jgi:hypothetical protein